MNGVDEKRGGIRLHIFVLTKTRARRSAKLPSCSGSCPSVCYPPPLPPPRCRRPLLSRRLSLVVVSSPPRRRRCCSLAARLMSLRRVSPPSSAARASGPGRRGGDVPAQAVGHLRRGGAMRSEARRDKRKGKRRGRLNRLVHWAFTLVTQIELTVSYLTRRQPRASSSDRRRGAPARRDQRQPAPRRPPTVVPADESSKCVSSQRRIFPSGAGRRVEPSLQQQRRRPWGESFLSRTTARAGP